jgi:hypothetical protein
MSVSMSSDQVIEKILGVCPKPLNVSTFEIKLFKEHPVRSGNLFFREQEYLVTSNEYLNVHSYCYASIRVWFMPDGSVAGIYNGGSLCGV